MNRKKYSGLLLVGLLFALSVTACGMSGNGTTNIAQENVTDDSQSEELKLQAVVKAVDTKEENIVLYRPDTLEEQTFLYNGGTQIYSKNGMALVISQLSCGEIVDVVYNSSNQMLSKVSVSKDAWEYKSVKRLKIDRDKKTISVTGRKYQYDDSVLVFSGDDQLLLMDLHEKDVVTVKGIGTKVYSFVIETGHGYIRLAGHDAFLGGTLEVDKDIFLKVESNMLVTVSEGEHTVVLRNGDMEAIEKVSVSQEKESYLDLSKYVRPAVTEGKIKFEITPSDATLYVNGKKKNYSRLVSLAYGNYNVRVKADGYEDYTGILRVQESKREYESIYIDLVEENSESATATPEATEAPEATEEATATTTPTAETSNEEYTITVNSPVGATVYLDDVYKGVAPVKFTEKEAGEHAIALAMDGYTTKSHTITIEEGLNNLEYSFADLEKSE